MDYNATVLSQSRDKYSEDGTPCSGYDEDGPYYCGVCIHQKDGICFHPQVLLDPALEDKRTDRGVEIDLKNGCCRYIRTKNDEGEL